MIEYKKEAERKVFKVSDLRFFTPYWKLDKISKKNQYKSYILFG